MLCEKSLNAKLLGGGLEGHLSVEDALLEVFGALEVHKYSIGGVWSFGGAQVLIWRCLEFWWCTSTHLDVFGVLGGAQGLIEGV